MNLNGDRALNRKEQDRFGFSEIAERLAESVVSSTSKDGMVVAIEGKWGSGKSSLINLMNNHINDGNTNRASTITFAPWLIGNSKTYVAAFMNSLADEVDRLSKNHGAIFTKADAKKISDGFKKYGASALSGLANLAELTEVIYPPAGIVKKSLRWGQKKLSNEGKEQSIEIQKEHISTILKKLDHRFVVILDDLDRLEPHEAVEVMRLIRSVADFPNVIYVLCYDKDILAHAIKNGLQVDDGEKYLQKIVQVSFHIPRPEAFDLRNWLNDEAQKIYLEENGQKLDRDLAGELHSVIDYFGDMETPRDVISILNSIKFHYPPVKDDVHYPDLVWLHITKVMQTKLYKWCENYLSEWSVIATGDASASGGKHLNENLMEIISKNLHKGNTYLYHLQQYIPGINKGANDSIDIFDHRNVDLEQLDTNKRIGSPDYWRYYFAFSNPKTSMSDSQLFQISKLAEDNLSELCLQLLKLAHDFRKPSGSWLDYYFDRISRTELGDWTPNMLANMAFIIADAMDEICHSIVLQRNTGRPVISYEAALLVNKLLRELKSQEPTLFSKTIVKIFGEAAGIVWLLDEFVDKELRKHGIISNKQYISDSSVLTSEEAEDARQSILARLLKPLDRERLYNATDIVSALFRWRDFDQGSYKKPQAWFAEFTKTDKQFLHVLQLMRGWRSSSGIGVTLPLPEDHVEPFSDWNACIERLNQISQSNTSSEDLVEKADKLIEVLEHRSK